MKPKLNLKYSAMKYWLTKGTFCAVATSTNALVDGEHPPPTIATNGLLLGFERYSIAAWIVSEWLHYRYKCEMRNYFTKTKFSSVN